ncbi:MAG: hypothetical protein HYZ14_00930 [Bacteroidetes bacterium]|nr:hypothetical protein [Bacteroidota bacterium]
MKKNELIDVRNLFCKGDKVPWVADNEPGFLSYKRCPNLWSLGARSSNSQEECISLIEDIITCAHLYSNRKKGSKLPTEDPNIYIKAYNELTLYLRYLFSYYNSLIGDRDFQKKDIREWGWTTLFKNLNNDSKYDKVFIICYNYDIILERLLMSLEIDYTVKGLQDTDHKFELIKPHGSISFRHSRDVDNSLFNIRHDQISSDGDLKDIKIDYEATDKHTIINPMIPPAGDSSRFDFGWSGKLRDLAKQSAQQLIAHDECIICGLSYWHVDRNEIDELFLSMDNDINVKLVNPRPNQTLNAVISSVFKNYINYSDASQIHKI